MKWLTLVLLLGLGSLLPTALPHESVSSEIVGAEIVAPVGGGSAMLWALGLLTLIEMGVILALAHYIVGQWERQYQIGEKATAQLKITERALERVETSLRQNTEILERNVRRLEQLSRSNGAA